LIGLLLILLAAWFLASFASGVLLGLSGLWGKLEQRFPDRKVRPSRTYRFVSLAIGDGWRMPLQWAPIFVIELSEGGLRIRFLFPFELGSSPIFVPWHEVQVADTPLLFGVTNIYLGRPLVAAMRVGGSIARKIGDFRRQVPLSPAP
jgi:hypothetical protein